MTASRKTRNPRKRSPPPRDADAVVEHGSGADLLRDAGRLPRGVRSFRQVPSDGDFPERGRQRSVLARRDAARGGTARRRPGRCDLLERHLRVLARARSRSRPLRRHPSCDGHRSVIVGAGDGGDVAGRRIDEAGLVTPYIERVQQQIGETLAREGFESSPSAISACPKILPSRKSRRLRSRT